MPGCPPDRGRDQAEYGVDFPFVAGAVEHDPVARGEPGGQGDGMDFSPSCRDRGPSELGVQDDVQAAVPRVKMADLPVAEEYIPRRGGIWSRSQIARSAGWATVPGRSSTSGRANTRCARIACMSAAAF